MTEINSLEELDEAFIELKESLNRFGAAVVRLKADPNKYELANGYFQVMAPDWDYDKEWLWDQLGDGGEEPQEGWEAWLEAIPEKIVGTYGSCDAMFGEWWLTSG